MNGFTTNSVPGAGVLSVVSAVVLSTVWMVAPASADVTQLTYSQPGTYTWVVPSGVHAVTLDVWGAQGGRAAGGQPGGLGGLAIATLTVTPGDILEINVGGAGSDSRAGQFEFGRGGYNGGADGGSGDALALNAFGGGGGGGGSDVRSSRFGSGFNARVIAAGGGGGGSLGCTGGAGGGFAGPASGCSKWSGEPGSGGGRGGAAENDACCVAGESGEFGRGGRGATVPLVALAGEGVGGGGGGGGYWGGGGGSSGTHVPNTGFASIGGGAGGGGSNFIALNLALMSFTPTSGVRAGNGLVMMTYYVPSVSASVTPSANASGWNNANVDVTFTGSTAVNSPVVVNSITYSTSGSQSTPDTTVSGASASVTISAEGTTTARGTARDTWHDESLPATADVRIDKTPPAIFGARDVAPNANGWNNTDVTVTWNCNDGLSGVQSCSVPTVMNREAAGQTAVGISSDRAGNAALGAVSSINIDKTPPTISGARDLPPNARGWNNTDVAVIWTCNDALSGVDTCPAPTTVFAAGAGQSVSGTATDRAGNSASASVGNLNIDKTPPRLIDCRATDITDTRAVIRWSTSESADSQVDFGATAQRGTTTPLDATLTTGHAVTLQGLRPGTTYYAQPRSADIADNAATCDGLTFTTSLLSHSLTVDGQSGYGEAAHAADLNLTGDWTLELWFKDEEPNGFNHDFSTLLNKGDRQTSPESPYFVSIGFKRLLVGQRSGWQDYTINYDLWTAGVDPKLWHHLAASFQRSTRQLVLYLDGRQVAQGRLQAASTGNALPVQIGRNGAAAGKYFHGKLDDVRLWDLVRTPSEISSAYRQQLAPAPSHLVANWQFEDGGGSAAADTTGNHHQATLSAGASFSTDVHP